MIFEVTEEQIATLGDEHLTELLRTLLICEANRNNISPSSIAVSLNITAPDGGLDASISWVRGASSTQFLPSRNVGFQCKATDMTSAQCANELITRAPIVKPLKATRTRQKRGHSPSIARSVKPLVESLLSRGGGIYILLTTQKLNAKAVALRVKSMRRALAALKKPYSKSAGIQIYPANALRTWVNSYLSAIVYVQFVTGFPIIPGLKTWNEWNETFDTKRHRFPYEPDSNTTRIKDEIRELLSKDGTALRVVGLSGLGKTRLALEALRPKSKTDALSASVVYFNAGHQDTEIRHHVSEWRRRGLGGILVVDDCPSDLHVALHAEATSPGSRLSILTLDLDPNERLRDVTRFRLEPSDADHVASVVKKSAPGMSDDDAKKITALSSGFIYFAQLLCNSWKERISIEHALPDSRELIRILWGTSKGADAALRAIEACALVESAEIGDGTSAEAKFLADIAGLDAKILRRHLGEFQDRGLVECHGPYVRVRPHPLALRLCMDWWRRCIPSRAEQLFAEVPESMVSPLCDRLRMLNFLPEARSLTETLCGAQGPFGQAEVLSSARGARIFRALVELNPDACVAALSLVMAQYDDDALRTLDSPRREWVWGLERLAYHASTYLDAAGLLAKLAVAESEKYANNATGILLQTFHVQLPGTEASLETRGQYLSTLFDSEDERVIALALRCADSALTTEYFTRTSGAEDQGSGPSLKEYHPRTAREITSYWRLVVDLIFSAEQSQRLNADQALNVLASHLRGFVRVGYIELVDHIVDSASALTRGVWESGLNAITDISRYEATGWSGDQKLKLQKWFDAVAPKLDDIPSRLAIAINRPSWSDFLEEGPGTSSPAERAARSLAEECSRDFALWRPYLQALFQGEQRMGYIFGYRLGEQLAEHQSFVDLAISILINHGENANPIVLQGFLKAYNERDPQLVAHTIDKFLTTPALHKFATSIVITLQPPLPTMLRLVELVKQRALPPGVLRSFAYGQALGHLSPDQATTFAKSVVQADVGSAWTALELLYMYCFGATKERWPKLRDAVRDLHLSGQLTFGEQPNMHNLHIWKETALKLLGDNDPELAKYLATRLVASTEEGAHSFEIPAEVAHVLLARYGAVTWPIFGAQFLKKASPSTWTLSHYLGRGFRGSSEQVGGPIDALAEGALKDWLAKNPAAASSVAGMIRPLQSQGDAYVLTPLARFLVDNYGHDVRVLGSLSANMHSGTWWGSRAPHYEKIRTLSKTLLNHPRPSVRAWASRLAKDMGNWLEREQREADARSVGRW